MEWLRGSLERLGWPVETLSDEKLTDELYRRWVACGDERIEPEREISVAAAHGIFDDMAKEGNLDALCWQEVDVSDFGDDAAWVEPGPIHARDQQDSGRVEIDYIERRESTRTKAADIIRFGDSTSPNGASGWLVDVSVDGIAFIAETDDVPAIGAQISSTNQRRRRDSTEVGGATEIRTK